jgi:squalene synthase HpnC
MSIRSAAAYSDYEWCRTLAHTHYENFPVASWLLPRRLRNPVAAIYAFARSADDVADETDIPPEQKLSQLERMEAALESALTGTGIASPMFAALADTIDRYSLPLAPFRDLLGAFRQDVTKTRYADFGEVMDYCRRSANPVGRLLLHLAGHATPRNLAMSDAVCSALQLINFQQDLFQDYRENNRIYLPQDEMRRFGVSEDDIHQRRNSPGFTQMMRFQVQRSAGLLRMGSPLGTAIPGRLGVELRAIILSGARVLEKLHEQKDVFSRPRLTAVDRARIAWRALIQTFR